METMEMDEVGVFEDLDFTAFEKLSKDLKLAAATLSPHEARFLVDYYYTAQESRKRTANQIRALSESGEPNQLIRWLFGNVKYLEKAIAGALTKYAESQPLGQWCLAQRGIAGIITAGLLAHIDLAKAPTCGHIWSFAGITGHDEWIGAAKAKEIVGTSNPDNCFDTICAKAGQKPESVRKRIEFIKDGEMPEKISKDLMTKALSMRPWNARLKTLLWKLGESFMKVSNHPESFYGHIYLERKAFEWQNNVAGRLSMQAVEKMKTSPVGKSTSAYNWLAGCYDADEINVLIESGLPVIDWKPEKLDAGKGLPMLPPAHIGQRAKRFAVKLFLSHYHEVGRGLMGLPVPTPYVFAHKGHVHRIPPPTK